MQIDRAVVFGATGSTGRLITRELVQRGIATRVVSRSDAHLARDFGDLDVERVVADVGDPEAARRAADGCAVIFHCVGQPLSRFEQHVTLASNTAGAMEATGARGVLITSYWSFWPYGDRAITEKHARGDETRASRLRKEQEDLMTAAGAAVIALPDFYGPEGTRGLSILNDALDAVRAGRSAMWPGDPDAPREFLYLPDLPAPAVDLASNEGAYGNTWIVAGSGWIAPRRALQMAADASGQRLKVRAIGRFAIGVGSLFNAEVRAFKDVSPLYFKPVFFDPRATRKLIGDFPCTRYQDGIPATLEWLSSRSPG